ncbi:hypothetical protein H0H92_005717 [Tricholoma furcatifolium]|nr:hypothetical protein H0H92_005717 [Tricholoma furcatifolium]
MPLKKSNPHPPGAGLGANLPPSQYIFPTQQGKQQKSTSGPVDERWRTDSNATIRPKRGTAWMTAVPANTTSTAPPSSPFISRGRALSPQSGSSLDRRSPSIGVSSSSATNVCMDLHTISKEELSKYASEVLRPELERAAGVMAGVDMEEFTRAKPDVRLLLRYVGSKVEDPAKYVTGGNIGELYVALLVLLAWKNQTTVSVNELHNKKMYEQVAKDLEVRMRAKYEKKEPEHFDLKILKKLMSWHI